MKLLDFQELETRVNAEETTKTAHIVMYSVIDNSPVNHSGTENFSDDEIKEYICSQNATGSVGEIIIPNSTLYLVGIGNTEIDVTVLKSNVNKAMKRVYERLQDKTTVVVEQSKFIKEALYGLVLSSYNYNFLKGDRRNKEIKISHGPEEKKIFLTAMAQNFARFLGDTPANHMTPARFVEYAKKFLEGTDVAIEVLKKEEMTASEMGLILSVSQGSAEEPRLLHVRHNPLKSTTVDLALVGKGVTFDAGGICLKPSAGMAEMKGDMLGAATLLAAFRVLVVTEAQAHITLTIPLVENLPSSSATKPGDVFKGMNGMTVEVDNTDAEGRLILADALIYAQKDQPKYLIDAATLTGAMKISLGSVYSGYFTNDEDLSEMIFRGGDDANDLFWRLPLATKYLEDLKSHVADIKNFSGRSGGSCKSAMFLQEFVAPDVKWAHFDIAGMIEDETNKKLYGKGMSGRPVRAMVEIFGRIVAHLEQKRLEEKQKKEKENPEAKK